MATIDQKSGVFAGLAAEEIPAAGSMALGKPKNFVAMQWGDDTPPSPGSGLLDELISWWTLNEETGIRLDSHGPNDLAPINSPTFGVGVQNNAVDLNPAGGQFLDGGTAPTLQGGAKAFSVIAWVKPDSFPAAATILSNVIGTAYLDYSLLYNGNWQWYVNAGSNNAWVDASTFGPPPTGQWQMIYAGYEWVINASQMYISVNAGTIDIAGGIQNPNDGSTDFRIGSHAVAGRYFDGLIDETAFWDRLLTPDEITWLYNGGLGRTYADLTP